jgi:membrane-bound ClpP family serine protease
VFIHGEYWDATSDEMIPENTQVEVLEVKDTGIKVKKA